MGKRNWHAVAGMQLNGLMLAAALAAARRLAPGSLVGLLEHLLPDGDRARALLCLSAHVLCPRVLVSPQANVSRQRASTGLQFLREVDPPVHGTHPTTARLRLHHHTCMHSLPHALTAHQPVSACAARIRLAGTLAFDAHIDHVVLVLVDCASQVVTLGQDDGASGLGEAGCAAWGFVCGSRVALSTVAEARSLQLLVGCEYESN